MLIKHEFQRRETMLKSSQEQTYAEIYSSGHRQRP